MELITKFVKTNKIIYEIIQIKIVPDKYKLIRQTDDDLEEQILNLEATSHFNLHMHQSNKNVYY